MRGEKGEKERECDVPGHTRHLQWVVWPMWAVINSKMVCFVSCGTHSGNGGASASTLMCDLSPLGQ